MNTKNKSNPTDMFNIGFMEVNGILKILIFELLKKYIIEGDFDFESINTQTNGYIDSPDKFHEVWKANDMDVNYEINEPQGIIRIYSNNKDTLFSITIKVDIRQMTYTEQSLTSTIINFKNVLTHTLGKNINSAIY